MMMKHVVFILGIFIFALSINATEFKELTVEDIYYRLNFRAGFPLALKWLPGGEKYSYVAYDSTNGEEQLRVVDVRSGKEKTVLSGSEVTFTNREGETEQISLRRYQWLESENGLLFIHRGDLFFYDLKRKKFSRLTDTEDIKKNVTLSPDNKWVSFVRGNNIFALKIKSKMEKQLTFDGSETLLNGKKDWVYQEELGKRGDFLGYWWSPDSRHIAYYQIDDGPVPEYPLVDYNLLHPSVEFMRYPKAGDPNPVVKIGVLNVETGDNHWLNLSKDPDVYFPRVYWLPDGQRLAVMRMDRHQQKLDFLFVNIKTGQYRTVLSERDPFWINIDDFVYFFKKKNWFLWGSEKSGFRHLYLYDYQGNQLRQLTAGDWAVTSFEGVDEKRGLVYFIGTEKDLLERHLYRVDIKAKKQQRLTNGEGVHRPLLAPGRKYYWDYYSDPETPLRLSLYRADGKLLRILAGKTHSQLAEYRLPKPEFFTISGDNGLTYYASMIKPSDFDPGKKYPVLIYVYGGPHSQVVIKRYPNLWHQLMAQKGYIVFSLDNRGTANRGRKWETAIYKRLGKVELEDQLRGVEYLKTLPYVDADRIGIWGWSYGGYMVLYALTHSDVFKAGAAVAPVTSWRYYDSIYTERYMGLPPENEAGYLASSPMETADSLKGKLFIVHGLSDDNVHFQNTVQFIDRLIKAGIEFRMMAYPSQGHSILSTADRVHLYRALTEFFLEKL